MASLFMITMHWLSVSLPLMMIPTIVLIVVIAVSPETFRADWPVDIQRHMASPTSADRRNATIAGLVFFGSTTGSYAVVCSAVCAKSRFQFLVGAAEHDYCEFDISDTRPRSGGLVGDLLVAA